MRKLQHTATWRSDYPVHCPDSDIPRLHPTFYTSTLPLFRHSTSVLSESTKWPENRLYSLVCLRRRNQFEGGECQCVDAATSTASRSTELATMTHAISSIAAGKLTCWSCGWRSRFPLLSTVHCLCARRFQITKMASEGCTSWRPNRFKLRHWV